jgi:acylphosphatase
MTDQSERATALLVHFSGSVQGVGFRATAAALARDYPVTGWVRNLSDGRVQLLAEGPEEAVQAFLEAVRSRFRGYIEDEQVERRDFSGSYTRFGVAR